MIADYTFPYSGHSRDTSPYEEIAWAIIEQAVDDLKLLCRRGLITKEGTCLNAWPKRIEIDNNGYRCNRTALIDQMRDPLAHFKLREFFLDGVGQGWCDLLNSRFDAPQIYAMVTQEHGAIKYDSI